MYFLHAASAAYTIHRRRKKRKGDSSDMADIMKDLVWGELAGAAAAALLIAATKAGFVAGNVDNLDLFTEGGIIVADMFASPHMGEGGAAFMGGAAAASLGMGIQTAVNKWVLKDQYVMIGAPCNNGNGVGTWQCLTGSGSSAPSSAASSSTNAAASSTGSGTVPSSVAS